MTRVASVELLTQHTEYLKAFPHVLDELRPVAMLSVHLLLPSRCLPHDFTPALTCRPRTYEELLHGQRPAGGKLANDLRPTSNLIGEVSAEGGWASVDHVYLVGRDGDAAAMDGLIGLVVSTDREEAAVLAGP
jgi:hypothetical protein